MKSQQIVSLVIIYLYLHTGGLAYERAPDDICVLQKNCPSIWSLTQQDVDERKCGSDGRYSKIWCSVKCTTPAFEPGVCKPVKECKSFETILAGSNFNRIDTIEYLQKFDCKDISTYSDRYVCCTNEIETTSIRSTSLSTTSIRSASPSTTPQVTSTSTTEKSPRSSGGLGYERAPDDICVLPKSCPSIRNNIWTQQDVDDRKCGSDGIYIKIWCSVKCTTPALEPGVCKPLEECKSFKTILAGSNFNRIDTMEYLQKFDCKDISAYSDRYVCCTNQIKTTSIRSTSLSTTSIRSTSFSTTPQVTSTSTTKKPPRSYENCGIETSKFKVIRGSDAEIGDHPWVAILQYTDGYGAKKNTQCGGTLISRRYVLTAAHCKNTRFGTLSNVLLGVRDTRKPIECVGKYCALPQVIAIENIISHPDWINAKNQFYDDIALLRLAQDAQFTDMVRPICLPKPNQKPQYDEDLTIAGWGRTETGNSSTVKKLATIRRQSAKTCLNTISFPLRDSQLCVGGGREDSCNGDSGGPLMLPKEDTTTGVTTWYLVGIVSLGYNAPCGTIGKPGIYTSVGDYVDWIHKIMY